MTGVCNFQDWLIRAMQFTLRDLKSEVPVVDGTVCAISTGCQTMREVPTGSLSQATKSLPLAPC